jgi:two-component system phosphate regulon sensor histidine kinase PhoR
LRLLTSPFFRRLFLPYLLLIAASVLVVGVLAAQRLRASFLQSTSQRLRDNSLLVVQLTTPKLSAESADDLREHVRALGRALGCRITIIDADGRVIADSEANPEAMEDHSLRPEVLAASTAGEGISIRRSNTVDDDLFYFARRAQRDGGPPYFVRLAVHLDDLKPHLATLYRRLGLIALCAIGVAGIVCYYFARRHSLPVLEVTSFADDFARGDLARRILRPGTGEVARLSAALNSMADSMSRLIAQTTSDKAELLAIVSSMSEALVAIDSEQRILLSNAAAERLLVSEAPDGALRGKYLWQVIRHEPVLKAVAHVLATRQKKTIDIGPLRGRYLDVCVCPFPHAQDGCDDGSDRSDRSGRFDGPGGGVIIVAHDTTESVRYQDLRKEFVANVSHELRTPLTAIKGFAETLRSWALDDRETARQYVATIEKHANQLSNLVDDLLELSRLESDEHPTEKVEVDLPAVVRRAADLLMPLAQRKRQSLVLEIDASMPRVQGIADYLERAVSNLIENAIKYTPEEGRITVRAAREPQSAVVQVTDTGIGIPPDDLPRIFERFYRVDRSRSREMGGTGLGLSIVKHVAQSHGGTIEASSSPGRGSTFTMKLPLWNR